MMSGTLILLLAVTVWMVVVAVVGVVGVVVVFIAHVISREHSTQHVVDYLQ
jgi:hypothetical protein